MKSLLKKEAQESLSETSDKGFGLCTALHKRERLFISIRNRRKGYCHFMNLILKLNLSKEKEMTEHMIYRPTVFISYNQKSGNAIADQIQKRLETIAVVVRDKTSIPDWGSIKAFMKSIREQDLIVMLITKEFLMSSGCMFEVVEVMKDEGWHQHTMFVVADDVADIYAHKNWPHYLNYWKAEKTDLENAIKDVGDSADSLEIAEELRKVKVILASLTSFLKCVADSKNPNINEAVTKIYQRVSKYSFKTEGSNGMPDYQQAAEQDDPELLYSLGRSYEIGDNKQQDYKNAEFCYRQAAELGHIKAECCLGIMYSEGCGTEINFEKARYWFRQAAEQGDAYAQYLLGKQILKQSIGSEIAALEAIDWYHKAAEQGYIAAQSALGSMYESGVGVKQDYEQANNWFAKAYQLTRKAAEQGDSKAQRSLGAMYEIGTSGLEKNVRTAAEWYLKAALQGDSIAQFSLGELYMKGKGVDQDCNEAIKWYEKAGLQEHVGALLCLGDLYAKGKDIERNCLKAKEYYKAAEELTIKSAERGVVPAQERLANFYKCGRVGEPDYDKAIYWYEKAATQGSVEAMRSLSKIYQSKERFNPEMVVKWYQRASSRGDSSAMMSLARMYELGDIVEQNYNMTISWYQQAASQGSLVAVQVLGEMFEAGIGEDSNIKKAVDFYMQYAYKGNNYARWRLGCLYEYGHGVPRNDGEAVRWYQSAAEHGDKRAQCSLAHMYAEGKGVFKDIEKAISWYERAASGEHGNARAQRSLGVLYLSYKEDYSAARRWFTKAAKYDSDAQAYLGYLYENGLGVKRDHQTALDWYRKSAKGSDIGQFWLGSMYEKGIGVPRSDKDAAVWYQKAANAGNVDAQACLAKIYEKMGDYEKAKEWYEKAKEQGN